MTEITSPSRNLFGVRVTLLILFIIALVSTPFVIWGDAFALPWLQAQSHRTLLLTTISIVLLAADSVAPVPSTIVILFLAANGGRIAGIVGGTLGLTAGVLAAAWLGRFAVGRIAPKFFPAHELSRMRAGLQRNLALTLACWRSVPVLAETSVILAASAGIPVRRIVWVTLLPNFLIAVIYSVAADDSPMTALVTFFATLIISLVAWWLLARRQRDLAGK